MIQIHTTDYYNRSGSGLIQIQLDYYKRSGSGFIQIHTTDRIFPQSFYTSTILDRGYTEAKARKKTKTPADLPNEFDVTERERRKPHDIQRPLPPIFQ